MSNLLLLWLRERHGKGGIESVGARGGGYYSRRVVFQKQRRPLHMTSLWLEYMDET